MRIRHASLLLAAALGGSVSGCGGRVVLDGSGGAGGTSATSTSATSTSATSTSATSTSTTSTSASSSSGMGGSGCPVLTPNEGDPCSSPGLVCHVPLCCSGTATCMDGAWHVVAIPCGLPCLSCPGTLGCAIGAVCVDNPIGGGPVMPKPHYNCARNPCEGAPLSCSCAASLCEVGPCDQASGTSVTCVSVAG